jgi:hypothetical protein
VNLRLTKKKKVCQDFGKECRKQCGDPLVWQWYEFQQKTKKKHKKIQNLTESFFFFFFFFFFFVFDCAAGAHRIAVQMICLAFCLLTNSVLSLVSFRAAARARTAYIYNDFFFFFSLVELFFFFFFTKKNVTCTQFDCSTCNWASPTYAAPSQKWKDCCV